MTHPIRPLTRRELLAGAGALIAGTASAQPSWPSRPIRMVVPFPAGAGPDIVARLLAESVGKRLNQSVFVENKPGASANLGADAVAKAPADGYTILYGFNQIATMNPHLFTKLSYDVNRDLSPVTQLLAGPYALLASPKLPAASLRELLDAARAAPGRINYASYGPGTASHLGMLMIEQRAGITMTHVPYRQGALTDLAADVVSLLIEPVTPAIPWIKDGRVKALAVTGPQRVAALPNVPTVSEVVPGVQLTGWQAVWVPARTPAPVVNRLHEAFVASLREPAIESRLRGDSLDVIGSTPEQMAAVVRTESQQWGQVIRQSGFKLD